MSMFRLQHIFHLDSEYKVYGITRDYGETLPVVTIADYCSWYSGTWDGEFNADVYYYMDFD